MDKSWINDPNILSSHYKFGLKDFIEFAKTNGMGLDGKLFCPCRRCRNSKRKSISQVESDLSEKGFCMYYKNWVFHGEPFSAHSYMSSGKNNNLDENGVGGETDFINETVYNDFDMNENGESDELPDLLDEIRNAHESGTSSEWDSKNFDKLLNDAQRELYPGCKKYSLLRFIVSFLHIKVMNHMTNKAFDMMLEFLKDVLPEGEILPSSFYGAMKILSGIGLGYQKIDVCKFDCALFWKENEKMDKCPICKESRWKVNNGKKKKVPQKVMWYFPLKARLQRLFMSSKTAEDMRWHEEKRVKEEGIMRHPADSIAWKDFDKQYPDFAKDSRNVRLGLATDGFNPFGNMSNSYSMWPVILVPYNLPAYKFMRKEFLILSLLIPGPRAPGKELDVFLRPAIDDLKDLFHGISTYDAYSGQNFQMRAAILWTISDFPAYGYLSGWSTSGYKACPCCLDDTASQRLRGKICFMGHRRFLNHDHRWRKQKAHFDGTIETRSRPKEFSGEQVLRHLNSLAGVFGEFGKNPVTRKKGVDKIQGNWRKKSIFFELPYWEKLSMRHCLDVMHILKNTCESLVATLLNIPDKTKDTNKARDDLLDMGIRHELHLHDDGTRKTKPPALYVMSSSERKGFCDFLSSIKFPDGYAANISKCVKDGKLMGLKTHDYHVLLQRLIPAGIRGYLCKEVNEAIFELSEFFRDLCSKTLKMDDLERLEKNAPLILCKLEKIFPPAFFDIMIHLIVHLPKEAKLGGPVHPRWMFPFESKHKEMLQRIHPENVDSRHEDQFTEWFKDHINQLHIDKSLDVSEELWALANGPIPFMTKHYSGCIVNEVRFHTRDRDDCRTTQNSGLVVEGDHKGKHIDFYGFVKAVVELTFFHAYKMAPSGKRLKRSCPPNTNLQSEQPPTSNSTLEHQSATTGDDIQINSNNSNPTQALANEQRKQKKGRGPTTGKVIEKMIRANGGKPLEIVFPEGCCKPIKYAAQLASGIGYVVRHLSSLKDIRTYDDIPNEKKQNLYGGLMGWFDFKDWETDPNVEMYVDDMLQNSYRQWRNTMHIDYKMLKAAGKDPLTSCPYDWIEQDEWKSMCDWFEDPIFKKKSEANTKNRAMLPYPHTGGSKSNHVRAQEMVPPSAIDAWTAAHIKKDGQFVNNTAKSLDDELKEERRQCIENGEIVNEVKIMENVLGKRAGRAKGLGMGVIPPQSSRKPESSANRALLEELKQCKEKIQCYEERIQAQDTQIQNLVQSQQGIQEMLQEFLIWKQKQCGGSS
ncbi:uncharacterized protein [Coffea arabica]|uniref:Uncharacterized protein isoform X3 n=1 Tax=Coffea arabica TaxID=13443 RepID=A0ABM4WJA4_COFAR